MQVFPDDATAEAWFADQRWTVSRRVQGVESITHRLERPIQLCRTVAGAASVRTSSVLALEQRCGILS